MQYGLGIDLGTTQTAAAVRVDGRIEVANLGGRRAEIPSLVFVKPDGGLLIGEAAERRGATEPARLAREFKRRIGDPVPILVGGVPFSAHALTAKLLRHVLDAVAVLQDGPPTVVTLTHPANWGPYKREQLDQAIRLADAGSVLLRTEPEAAALQHATARKIAPGETVAVYDLGGGTFDAAVLRRDGDGFALLGEPEGIEQLGGADFDEAVFGHVLQTLGSMADGMDPNDSEVMTALARLRRDCVEAKEALSFDTEVMIPVALPGLHTRVRLNRSELEAMIAPSLEDTVTAMRRALRSAGVTPDSLSAVLLAGGSSRIPLVAQLLSTALRRPVVADPHPEHSIAMGAAVATATVTGGASPFAAAVAPPVSPPPVAATRQSGAGTRPGAAATPEPAMPVGRGPADTLIVTPEPGLGATPEPGWGAAPGRPGGAPVSSPPAATGGAAAAAPANGASAAPTTSRPGTGPPAGSSPPVPVVPPVSFNRGAASVPGAASSGAVASGRGGGPAAPVSGSGSGQFPAFSPAALVSGRGGGSATSVAGPGSGSATPVSGPGSGSTAPVSGARTGYPPTGTTFGEPVTAGGKRGRTRLLVMASAVMVAVIAGGTALAVALTRDKGKDDNLGGGGGQVSQSASAPASTSTTEPAQPFPTDTMLIRVDSGSAWPPSRTAIYLLTPGSNERTKIVDTGGDTLPEWSNDRSMIAETRHVGDTNQIWVMDADGSNQRKIIGNVTSGRVAWSADDTKLAFIKLVDGVQQMFVITLGESTPRQLTTSSNQKDDPAWSPDGKSIAYWVTVNDVRQIFQLDVDNPEEPGKQLTKGESGPGVDPAWSPDGTQIAYTHGTGKNLSDIWLMDADGTDAHPLAADPAREMDPSFAPDGTWVAFTRGALEEPKITIVKLDGSGEKNLTKGGNREGHPCWS